MVNATILLYLYLYLYLFFQTSRRDKILVEIARVYKQVGTRRVVVRIILKIPVCKMPFPP